MDDTRCKVFLAAVDEGSFSAAARALGYTPSGVIRIVNAFEAEMGFPLLRRTHAGVELTGDGARLVPLLRDLENCREAVRQTCDRVRGLETGLVTVGSKYTAAISVLPVALKAFQDAHPRVRVDVLEGGSRDLSAWLAEGRVDCCFTNDPQPGCAWAPLGRSRLVAWLPLDHPCAQASAFRLEEFAGEPFIRVMPDNNMFSQQVLEAAGVRLDVRFTTIDYHTGYAMVAAGLGLGLGSEDLARDWSGNVAVVPIEPPLYLQLGLAYPDGRSLSPAARRFVECAKGCAERGEFGTD